MTRDFLQCLSVIELNILMNKTIDEYIASEKADDTVLLERKRLEIFMIKTTLNAKDNNNTPIDQINIQLSDNASLPRER